MSARLGPLAARPATAQALADVGAPGSRWRLPTPALLLDQDAFEHNIALMAQRARAAGLGLRPHAKSHKSAWVAERQMAAGALGVCCAKLGEAEALADAGIGALHLTSPIVGPASAVRAAALAARGADLMLVIDHPDSVADLARAAEAAGATLSVLIDVDVGLGRTGVADAAGALAVARAMAGRPSLRLRGVQGYGGHWQHLAGAQARLDATAKGMVRLTTAVEVLRGEGHPVEIVSGGGTGSFAADAALGVLTEVQAGSYVFMDRQYRDALADDPDGAFQTSLFVQAQVISANAPGWVTVDAGLKALATDGPAPRPVGARFGGCKFGWFGDEHGRLSRPGGAPVRLGERVELETPHCDPTVDRHDVLHLVRGDVLEAVLPIEGRGRSQ